MDHSPRKCFECQHYLGNFTCNVFPQGIPGDAITGKCKEWQLEETFGLSDKHFKNEE